MHNTRDLWFHESGHDIFATAMSWNRFHFICKFIIFDDKPTRNDRWKNDKYACMRKLFKKMNVQNAKCWFPSPLLAIDETLYPNGVQSASNSATSTSGCSMDYCTTANVICQPLTPTSHCHMLGNSRRLLEKQQRFMSPELTSILSI